MNTMEHHLAWLRATPKSHQFTRRETDVATPAGIVSVAVDAQDLPVLIVPIADDQPEWTDESSWGIRVNTHPGSFAGMSSRVIVIRCSAAEVAAPFAYLGNSLLETLAGDSSQPVKACATVLSSWQHLFATASVGLLSDEGVVGLLAELHVLEALCARKGPQVALDTWRGPLGEPHDFVGQAWALEIKATAQANFLRVHINGLGQLDPPLGSPLYLHLEVMKAAAEGDSLPSVVSRLVANGVNVLRLWELLAEAGFRWTDESKYIDRRFIVQETRTYAIDDTFPRIVRSTFPSDAQIDAIMRLDYVLALDSVTPILKGSTAAAIDALGS